MEAGLSDYDEGLVRTKNYDDDIVFRNGSFIRAPEGAAQ